MDRRLWSRRQDQPHASRALSTRQWSNLRSSLGLALVVSSWHIPLCIDDPTRQGSATFASYCRCGRKMSTLLLAAPSCTWNQTKPSVSTRLHQPEQHEMVSEAHFSCFADHLLHKLCIVPLCASLLRFRSYCSQTRAAPCFRPRWPQSSLKFDRIQSFSSGTRHVHLEPSFCMLCHMSTAERMQVHLEAVGATFPNSVFPQNTVAASRAKSAHEMIVHFQQRTPPTNSSRRYHHADIGRVSSRIY